MEDMINKIGSLLSDPESIKQIAELAQIFMSETANNNENSTNSDDGEKSSDDGLFSNFDFNTLLKIQEIINTVSGKDKDSDLLLALKPHLSLEKQKKVDKAIKLLKIIAVWNILKDTGILKDFFNS